jgi:hypothetical protein
MLYPGKVPGLQGAKLIKFTASIRCRWRPFLRRFEIKQNDYNNLILARLYDKLKGD